MFKWPNQKKLDKFIHDHPDIAKKYNVTKDSPLNLSAVRRRLKAKKNNGK